jgi:hypothetical protein
MSRARQPAAEHLRTEVRAVVDCYGWARAVELLGISQHAIERLLAGSSLLRTTIVATRVALAAIGERQP